MNAKSKVVDFILGFFGTLVAAAVVGGLIAASARIGTLAMAIGTAALLAYVVTVIVLFQKGRTFIALGSLCFMLVPLLALGACFIILANMNF